MSILKLMRDRQMYKYGQRVAKTMDGSRPGYRGSDYGDEARGTGGYASSGPAGGASSGGNYGGNSSSNNSFNNGPPGGGDSNMTYTAPTASTIDPGFQRALTEIAYQQQNPVYGDPDPYINVPVDQRDTITSFMDNYKANVKSNPLNLGILGGLKTLYQTNQAKNMMSGVPGYEFLDYKNEGEGGIKNIIGGGQDYSTVDPYIIPEDTTDIDNEETEDFIQRFKVKDDFRKTKGPERLIEDQAIAEMISKLYT
jgi:hypothetical protein